MPPANTLITPVVDRDDGGGFVGRAGPQKGNPTRRAIHGSLASSIGERLTPTMPMFIHGIEHVH